MYSYSSRYDVGVCGHSKVPKGSRISKSTIQKTIKAKNSETMTELFPVFKGICLKAT